MGADGKEIKLEAPTGDELPAKGFDPGKYPSCMLRQFIGSLACLARVPHA